MNNKNGISKVEEESVYCDKKDRMLRYLDEILGEIFEEDNNCKFKINMCESRLKEVFNTIEITEKKIDPNSIFFTPQVSQRTKFSKSLSDEISKLTKQIDEFSKKQDFLKKRRENILEIIGYLREQCDSEKKSETIINIESGLAVTDELHIKMLEIQENERNRIARDIHDSTVQNLTSLVHKAELCTKMVDRDKIQTKLELQTMIGTIRSAIDDLRMIIYDLRPMSIDDLGLIATVQRDIQRIELKDDINIELNIVNEEKDILPIINVTLYRIIQEACNNVRKHARAKNIYITISYLNDKIEVIIEDDGIGINNNKKVKSEKDLSGLGLSIMKERVYLLSGNIFIMNRDSGGTRVVVSIPV